MEQDSKGRFVKGNSGKAKGTKDKKTRRIDDLIEYLSNEGAERFVRAMDSLDDKTFANNYIQLIEFIKPKLSRQESTVTVDNSQPINISFRSVERRD